MNDGSNTAVSAVKPPVCPTAATAEDILKRTIGLAESLEQMSDRATHLADMLHGQLPEDAAPKADQQDGLYGGISYAMSRQADAISRTNRAFDRLES